ncbi:putative integrase family protein [Roseibium sp. TrichSKD4]|uniref:tyrosine-type recombinase/integrase n=1 Tax=Roseibium sp. TrichSKD4 TaxID=744980 RepID=UPI0001E5629D|nr:tyrosine-type recombinase/integrase [Roseibium sp. TrichSKD4]EFO33817.1 putative integrase family protein [Roseibium sp. TrichSKD4]
MTKVRLKGLSIYQRRGKWYVYYRANRHALVQGFDGTREELDKHLASPAILKLYSEIADRPKNKGFGTLGGLFEFYKTKERWKKLAPRTKADYQKVIDWLEERNRLKTPVIVIRPADIAMTRDKAAQDKFPKFSNETLALLSAAFSTGVEYGYAGLKTNSVLGIRRLHKNSKAANRRWTIEEWNRVWSVTPDHLKMVLGLARWTGARGQDIAVLRWDHLERQGETYTFLEYIAKKNQAECVVEIPASLNALLQSETRLTLTICKNSKGRPYPSENAMRKVWQEFKASAEFKEACPSGQDLTLHGLRVTYASELREKDFTDEEIARAIGDKSTAMGKHYGRGADARKFARKVREAMDR